MKKRHEVTQNVKSFLRMIDQGVIILDFPFQRAKGQWNLERRSLLIHSILKEYDITAIYSNSVPQENSHQVRYLISDGLQRLTTLKSYCQNEFALHPDTPSIDYEGSVYFIGDLFFKDLPELLQDAILDYSILMYYFVGVTEDEMAEMYFRVSNGVAHNHQQKIKANLGLEKATILNRLTEHAFFTEYSGLTSAQLRASGDEQVVVESLMLLDQDFAENLAFDKKTMAKYMLFLKSSDNRALFDHYELVLEYLVSTLEGRLRKDDDLNILRKRYLAHLIGWAASEFEKGIAEDVFFDKILKLNDFIDNDYMVEIFSSKAKNKKKDHINVVQDYLNKF